MKHTPGKWTHHFDQIGHDVRSEDGGLIAAVGNGKMNKLIEYCDDRNMGTIEAIEFIDSLLIMATTKQIPEIIEARTIFESMLDKWEGMKP